MPDPVPSAGLRSGRGGGALRGASLRAAPGAGGWASFLITLHYQPADIPASIV